MNDRTEVKCPKFGDCSLSLLACVQRHIHPDLTPRQRKAGQVDGFLFCRTCSVGAENLQRLAELRRPAVKDPPKAEAAALLVPDCLAVPDPPPNSLSGEDRCRFPSCFAAHLPGRLYCAEHKDAKAREQELRARAWRVGRLHWELLGVVQVMAGLGNRAGRTMGELRDGGELRSQLHLYQDEVRQLTERMARAILFAETGEPRPFPDRTHFGLTAGKGSR